jgi:hypothetical protein
LYLPGQVARDSNVHLASRIHLLNVLRAVFKDTELSLDVIPYISAAFIVAIDGTQSIHWNIKNCSSLLFAALIARSMGRGRINDSSKRTGVTAAEFFSRFPELPQYLLEILSAAEKEDENVNQGASNRHLDLLHPGAYLLR